MELLDYKRTTRIAWRALADKAGVPHSNLHALAHGKRDCSMETARLIEDATGGVVTSNDIQLTRRRYLASARERAPQNKATEYAA